MGKSIKYEYLVNRQCSLVLNLLAIKLIYWIRDDDSSRNDHSRKNPILYLIEAAIWYEVVFHDSPSIILPSGKVILIGWDSLANVLREMRN